MATISNELITILFSIAGTYYVLIMKSKVPLWNLIGGGLIIILGLLSAIIGDTLINFGLFGVR